MQASKLYMLVFLVVNQCLFTVETSWPFLRRSVNAIGMSTNYSQYRVVHNTGDRPFAAITTSIPTERAKLGDGIHRYRSNYTIMYPNIKINNDFHKLLLLKSKRLQASVWRNKRSVPDEVDGEGDSFYRYVTIENLTSFADSNNFTRMLYNFLKYVPYNHSNRTSNRKPLDPHAMPEYSRNAESHHSYDMVDSGLMDNVNADMTTSSVYIPEHGKHKDGVLSSREDFSWEFTKRKNIPSGLIDSPDVTEANSTENIRYNFVKNSKGISRHSNMTFLDNNISVSTEDILEKSNVNNTTVSSTLHSSDFSSVAASSLNNTDNSSFVASNPDRNSNINISPLLPLTSIRHSSPTVPSNNVAESKQEDERRSTVDRNENYEVVHPMNTEYKQNNSREEVNNTGTNLSEDLITRLESKVTDSATGGNCSIMEYLNVRKIEHEDNLTERANYKNSNDSRCLTCGTTEQQIKQVRLQMFKTLLARKLRLDPYDLYREVNEWERTIQDRTPKLPDSVIEQTLKDNAREIERDEFHARDQELIIAGEDMGRDCIKMQVTGCYSFNLKGKVKGDVAEATLWLYKMKDANDINGQTFTLYELERLKSGRLVQSSLIASMDTDTVEDWVVLNVTRSLRKWVQKRKWMEMLAIRCVTCAARSHRALFGTKLDYRPLLIIKYDMNDYLMRNKRSASCDPRYSCCKRDLMVNFHEIGMYDIIQPRTLSVGFCYGECNEIHQYTSNHTAIKQRARWSSSMSSQHSMRQQLKPCCVPVILKDIFIMTSDGDGTLVRKLLPKVIVETCGCM